MDDCIIVKRNLGVSRCTKLPALPRMMITTPRDWKIPAADLDDDDAIKAALQAALLDEANRIYLWPAFVGFEDVSRENKYEDTPLSIIPVDDGQYRFRISIHESICLHKAMFSHRDTKGRVILFDVKNQMVGTLNDDGDFLGFDMALLNTEKLKFSDGNVSTKTPVFIALADNLELDEHGAVLKASYVNNLLRLTDITLELVSVTALEIVVRVYATCDGTPIIGLVLADWIALDGAGAAQSITSSTEGEDGVYTLADPAFVDGTLTLKGSEDLSIQAYEVQNVLALNVP